MAEHDPEFPKLKITRKPAVEARGTNVNVGRVQHDQTAMIERARIHRRKLEHIGRQVTNLALENGIPPNSGSEWTLLEIFDGPEHDTKFLRHPSLNRCLYVDREGVLTAVLHKEFRGPSRTIVFSAELPDLPADNLKLLKFGLGAVYKHISEKYGIEPETDRA